MKSNTKQQRGSIQERFHTSTKPRIYVKYVQQYTALTGRGYLALRQDQCLYYGREDFLGDEDEVLKEYVKNYHPDTEVVFVWQVRKDSA